MHKAALSQQKMHCSGWRAGLCLDPVSLKAKKKKNCIPAAASPTLPWDCINSSHPATTRNRAGNRRITTALLHFFLQESYAIKRRARGVEVRGHGGQDKCVFSGRGEIQLREKTSVRQHSAGSSLSIPPWPQNPLPKMFEWES